MAGTSPCCQVAQGLVSSDCRLLSQRGRAQAVLGHCHACHGLGGAQPRLLLSDCPASGCASTACHPGDAYRTRHPVHSICGKRSSKLSMSSQRGCARARSCVMSPQSPWTPFQSAVERGVRFTVTGTLRGGLGENAAERMWYLHFRWAQHKYFSTCCGMLHCSRASRRMSAAGALQASHEILGSDSDAESDSGAVSTLACLSPLPQLPVVQCAAITA